MQPSNKHWFAECMSKPPTGPYKKEAAEILIDLQKNKEDERLMSCRRLLLNQNAMDDNDFPRDFRERLEQACWPWPYPNYTVPPAPYNSVPIGYPTWAPHSHWFLNGPASSYFHEPAFHPYMQHHALPGMSDYHGSYPWHFFPHQPGMPRKYITLRIFSL